MAGAQVRGKGRCRAWAKLLLSAAILAAAAWAADRLAAPPSPAAGNAPADLLLARGRACLTGPENAPYDRERAEACFEAVRGAPDAGEDVRGEAVFLGGWGALADRVPDYPAGREGLGAYLDAYPEGPHRNLARFLLGLALAHDPVNADPRGAAAALERLVEEVPQSVLAAHASVLLAGLYEAALGDPRKAAGWYEAAFENTVETHHLDERLGFLYLRARLLRHLGDVSEAEALYRRILDLGEGGTGSWTDRALDGLDALGAKVDRDYFPGMGGEPIPMTDHRFTVPEPVEIAASFWILEKKGMGRGIREVIDRYEARTGNVKVRLVDLPYTGYHDWLQSQILGKDIPDIVQIDNGSAIRYGAYQGKLVDMTPHLAAANPYTGLAWGAMYHPQFILSARDPVFRKNWIISWASENTAYIYNKDAFRAAGVVRTGPDGSPLLDASGRALVAEPRTWDDLIEAFRKLRAHGVYGEVCNFFPDPAPIIWQLPYYRRQLYDDLIPKLDRFTADDFPDPMELARSFLDGTLDLRDPEVAEPWRLLYEKSEYWVPGTTSLDIQQAFQFFAQGKAATIFWVSTDLPGFEEMSNFEVGVFPFPLLEGSTFYDGAYSEEFSLSAFEFAVPSVTRERGTLSATVDFLQYFTSPEAQEILSHEGVCLSPIKGVPVPDKVRPFLTRVNRRGTHQVYFDPFTISIIKEPYWVDARDKLWDELTRLLGPMPNFAYFRTQTGGNEAEYSAWREARFNGFLDHMQGYFRFAYERVVSEYPEDAKRELHRLQRIMLRAFAGQSKGAEPGAGNGAGSDTLRGIVDSLGTITRCESMIEPRERAERYEQQGLSRAGVEAIQRLVTLGMLLVVTVAALAALWAGVLARIVRESGTSLVLLPTLVLLAVFIYTPACSAVYHAFFRWNGSNICEYIGLAHFERLFTDGVLHDAVLVMLIFLVVNILKLVPTVLVAVILFHLANRRMQYIFRVVFVLPMAIPGMVGLLIWKYFYRMDGGLLNWLFLKLGIVDVPVNWLGTEDTVVASLLFIGFPWVSTVGVLILLAGLQGISVSVFEAATVDGCGVWRRFWQIELPLILGQVKLNVVLITIATIQDFWLPLVLTQGGPNNASMLPGLWMYQNAFRYGKMGYASALGVAMFLAILLLTYISMRAIRPHEE